MEHLRLAFEDIMQSRILFYDKIAEGACFDICKYLRIDNMPAIDGVNYYELETGEFKKRKIDVVQKLSVNEGLFSARLIDQFRTNRHNVLFVFEEEVLRGVVHICDYNRDVVLQTIQDDILSFERKLRQLILLHGLKNDDMLTFYEYKMGKVKNQKDIDFYLLKIENYKRRIDEINSLGSFQIFEFSDLMSFVASSHTNTIHKIGDYDVCGVRRSGVDVLRELRNIAMHGKNPVVINKETSIYSLESLQRLIESLSILRKEYSAISEKIRGHSDYQKSIELDNRNKLEIIHNHHPKALEYFLAFNIQ